MTARPFVAKRAITPAITFGLVSASALALALALALACTLSACHDAKPEASSLVRAVERFHLADPNAKPGAAATVAGLACRDPEVCDAKRVCTEATGSIARSLALKSEVEAGLGDVQAKRIAPDDARARALPGKLDEAEDLLKRGRTSLETCDDKLAALKLKYGV